MTTPKPTPTPPAPIEDQPPWVEPVPAPIRLPNPEAAWVAWWNFSVPVEQYDFENETEYVEYVPLSVTIRDGEPVTNMFEQVSEFAKMALLNGWVPISEKQWTAMDVSGKPKAAFTPPAQASSPLPPAAQPGQPWQPQQQAKPAGQWTPPQGVQPQPQAPQQQAGASDNTFVADTLLVVTKVNTSTNQPYTELRLKGPRYHKFGVRIWPDKLDAVLPGWSGAPVGTHPLVGPDGNPAQYKCTFSWDEKPGKDGTPQPKNVYAMELAQ